MAWLTTVLKLAPHVIELGKLGVSALPNFTQRKSETPTASIDPATQQQIAELQAAALKNAEDVHTLASDLKNAITAIEQGGQAIETRFRRLAFLAYAALGLSILSALSTLAFWLHSKYASSVAASSVPRLWS